MRTELMPGSIVMIVDKTYIANPSLRPSTVPKFVGPYVVVGRTLHGPFILRDTTGAVLDRHIPLDQMKILCRAGDKPMKAPPVDGEESFVVEEILDDMIDENEEQQYLVKWKDYPVKDATWEPISQFDDYACIEKYWKNKIMKTHKKIKNKKRTDVSLILYVHDK